jgi:hypothetical protein
MSAHKDGPAAHFEVDDAEAAFHRMEEATRKILAVPKKELDRKAPQKSAKKKSKRR